MKIVEALKKFNRKERYWVIRNALGPTSNQLGPDGHPKLLHLWPVKLLQAGRTDGDYTGVAVMREAASFNR